MEYGGSVLSNGGLSMRKLCLTIAFFFLTATSVLSADFLYHSDGPYKGKVVDLETGEPVEGAVVAAAWFLTHRFCDAKEIVTDKNGEFVLPKGSCFSFWPFTEMDPAHVVVFKPGYLGYPPLGSTFEEGKGRMPGFTGHEFQNKKDYNIIKLGKPKTLLERQLTFDHAGGLFIFDEAFEKLPMLLKLINQEGRGLGLQDEIGPSKNRDRK
jgi:hypothetical protein